MQANADLLLNDLPDDKARQELREILGEDFEVDSDYINEAKFIVTANLYLQRGQCSKAIDILTNSGIQRRAIWLALGDLYRIDGKNVLSAENYQKAIEEASSTNDKPILIAAKRGLAMVSSEGANTLVQEARAMFASLEERVQADNLELRQRVESSDVELRSSNQNLIFATSSCPGCNGQSNKRKTATGFCVFC